VDGWLAEQKAKAKGAMGRWFQRMLLKLLMRIFRLK
jgi:hypothetical protein